MKYRILTILTIFLIVSSASNVVSANIIDENSTEIAKTDRINESKEAKRTGERVTATSQGYQNITFDDGYNGYCANKYLKDADIGDEFIVQDTSKLVNPNYNESVGNYLKILFVDHYDYVMANQLSATLAVWEFTDNPYKTDSYLEIIPTILTEAQDGRIIPDHGEIKKINNTTEAIFDFECLESTDDKTQSFFGYRITYREILSSIMNSTEMIENITTNKTLEDNKTTENNNNTQENNETINNNTQTETKNNETAENNNNTQENNETINNNTQTETKNNETAENNETTNNNTQTETKNNTTKTENNTETNMTPSNNDNNPSEVMSKDVDNGYLEKENNGQNPINLIKHTTGDNTAIGLGLLLFLTIVLIIKYRRD